MERVYENSFTITFNLKTVLLEKCIDKRNKNQNMFTELTYLDPILQKHAKEMCYSETKV